MKHKTTVVAIIPSLCSLVSYPVLKKCINSLRASASTYKTNLKIVIVTNGKELTLKDLNSKIDQIIKVKNPYSFAKMNNIAINKSIHKFNPEWILLINDDAYVKHNFFKYLISSEGDNGFDVIVPLVYNHNQTEIDSFGIEYLNSGHAKNSQSLNLKTQLMAASCLLIHTKLLEKIHAKHGFYFNSILTSYFEDVEFSIRAIAIGAKIRKVKQMVAYHKVSYTNGKKSKYVMYHSFRNIVWTILMTWPLNVITRNFFNILLVQGFMFILSLRMKDPWLYIKIWPETVIALTELLKKRRKILNSYSKDFRFENILSQYTFRTYNHRRIKFLNIV